MAEVQEDQPAAEADAQIQLKEIPCFAGDLFLRLFVL